MWTQQYYRRSLNQNNLLKILFAQQLFYFYDI